MAIELKQSLRLSQQLVITPQLQQAIKLLQLSRLELSDLVQGELLENPVLEEATQAEEEEVPPEMAKEVESETPLDKSHEEQTEVGSKDGELIEPKEFDWENYIGTYNNTPGEDIRSFSLDDLPTHENITAKRETLQEHLEWQLRMMPLSERDEEMGVTVIGFLDDNGYLTTTVEEIAQNNNYSVEEVKRLLKIIQGFDPAGVGARDLKECLLFQARYFGEDTPLLEMIISNHLHLLERKDFGAISRKTKIPIAKVISLARIISDMEPKPGRPYGGGDVQFITPDVYVVKVGSEYVVVLNEDGLPRLQISNFYRNMLSKQENTSGKAKNYVQEKLKSALWLIKSIHQRQRTLYRVAKCIVKFQTEFFEKGIQSLKPMILRDVAESIGVHESTVSRATSNKYMHTPQGIFELKFFFNSGVSRGEGDDIASETVKDEIKNIITAEDDKNPYSDKEITEILMKKNIDVARRTVAKYREILGVLPSSRRKKLY